MGEEATSGYQNVSTSQETQKDPLRPKTVLPRAHLRLADSICQLGTQGLWWNTQFILLSSRVNHLNARPWELDGQNKITQCFLQ